MTAFLIEYIAPLMFIALVVTLLLGYPVAFGLAAVGIAFALLGIQLGLLGPQLIQALPERLWGVMSNDTLLAVPFFTFMGLILERSGMAEDLHAEGLAWWMAWACILAMSAICRPSSSTRLLL